jgi:hypothetical protein
LEQASATCRRILPSIYTTLGIIDGASRAGTPRTVLISLASAKRKSPAIRAGGSCSIREYMNLARCRPAAALQTFFWAPVSIRIEKRCNHYRLIVACMLSGASRDRPVIVGWSTALRGQVINESLGQLPKKLAAGPRVLARTGSSRSQSGTKQGGPPHDHWAKLGQLRYTRSRYSFVAIALFSMKFIAPPNRA